MRIYPAYYNAGSLKLEKRYSRGLTFQVNYTWSKNINYNDSAVNGGGSTIGFGGQGAIWATRFNTRQFKGPASFDVPHRVALSYVYQLPVKTANKVANAIVANWTFSGIATFDNGFPFGPRMNFDNANIGVADQFPNVVGDPNAIDERTVQRWFNTQAFAIPPAFTFGNAGRNIMRGPASSNWDVSLGKKWPIKEEKALDFRAEAFNVLNHPVFDVPNIDMNTPQFGTISRTRNRGRSIQFQLKFIF